MGNITKGIDDFKVTLAHKINDRPIDWTNTKILQPKLDGVRCYTRLVDGKVQMFSRNHKRFYNCMHIEAALAPIFKAKPSLILDGELYNHDLKADFGKIISLVRKQTPTDEDVAEAAKLTQYHIYDLYDDTQKENVYTERYLRITSIVTNVNKDFIQRIESKVVFNNEEIRNLHEINKNNGYEGSMLRSDVAYEQKRSYNLAKVKDWSDTEFTITDFVEGKGKFANGLGKFIGVDLEGRDIEVPWPNLTIKDRQEFWSNRNLYLGKIGTFIYFERTKDGAYRFPKFKAFRNYE